MLSTTIPYLTLNDYLPSIQSGQLNNQLLDAVTQGGLQQRKFAESWSIGKALLMLNDYFDLSSELTPTLPFSYKQRYYPGDRCVIDFPAWVASSNSESEGDESIVTYNIGDCVIYIDGNGYCCKEQNSDTSFNPNKWTQIGEQYDIYYIPFPYPKFELELQERRGLYLKGWYQPNNKVYFNGRVWQCIVGTNLLSHQASEQYLSTSSEPTPNIFPELASPYNLGTGTSRDNQQWQDLGDYSFIGELPFYANFNQIGKLVATAGVQDAEFIESEGSISNEVQLGATLIKDNVWTLGDNRDPVFLQAIVDMAIWRLCSRIAPGNIPKLRDDNFRQTWSWLVDVQKGTQSIAVPKIMPTQVGDLSAGSNPKVINRLR